MLIQFTRDFRSAATNEEHYEAGAIVDLPLGQLIVDEGAAVVYTEPEPEGKPEPTGNDVPPPEPEPEKSKGRKAGV